MGISRRGMASETRKIYLGGWNKGFSSNFQTTEESWSVQGLKHWEYGNEDDDKDTVNNVRNSTALESNFF